MDKELEEKIKSLKSDGKKKKGPCKSCKKKQPVTELPQVIEIEEQEDFYTPTKEDIVLAYVELGNRDLSKRTFINKVYKFIFDEDFDFGCEGCTNVQTRKLKNFINETLKVPVT
jgi:hypothetical protein